MESDERDGERDSVFVCVYVKAWLGKFIVKCRKINIKHFATNMDTF